MILGGKQTLPADNSKSVMSAQVSYLGQVKEMPFITPYGLFSSPPINSTWVVIPLRNNADDVIGFGNDYANKPPLLSGEVCLYNTQTKSKIILDSSGSIRIESENELNIESIGSTSMNAESITIDAESTTIEAENTTIDGNSTNITGNLYVATGATGIATGASILTITNGIVTNIS